MEHGGGGLVGIEGIRAMVRAVDASPDDPELVLQLAQAMLACGESLLGVRLLRRVLAMAPDHPVALRTLVKALHPGAGYLEVLCWLHEIVKPKLYLEIGVETGLSLRLAGDRTDVVGVEPAPQQQFELSPRTRLAEMTSDAFFDPGTSHSYLNGRTIDLAFIDGLHHFDQGLRDFINVEAHSRRDGVVAVHDCSPVDALSSTRERRTSFWTGDTWRLVPCLNRYRPDLRIVTLAAPPSGLALITDLDPGSTRLVDHYDRAVAEFNEFCFDRLDADRPRLLGLTDSDEATVRRFLA